MTTFGPYPGRVVAIHDGDTLTFDLDLGFGVRLPGQSWDGKTMLSCRVYGIDAPELSTTGGKDALDYLQTLIQPGAICEVLSHGWDKFGGRFDGEVTLPDGRDLATLMIQTGHAVAYPSK